MTERARNLLIGLAGIVGLLAIAGLLLLFGELDAVLNPRYEVTLLTNHAAGLRRGSSVELNGVPIGIVDDVAVRQDVRFPVRVTALVNQDAAIPAETVPYSTSSLLGGPSVLELQAAPGADLSESLPRDGTAVIESTVRYRLIEDLTTELDARMDPVLAALDRFDELAETYNTVGESLIALLEPQPDGAVAGGEPANLHTTVSRLYEVIDGAGDAIDLAGLWLGDEQLHADARSAVAKANVLIDRAGESLQSVTHLAGEIETDAARLLERIIPVTDALAATLEDVQRLTRLATEGRGTLGLMVSSPDLYNSLNDAAMSLDATLRQLQLFIQKVQAEGLPVIF